MEKEAEDYDTCKLLAHPHHCVSGKGQITPNYQVL